MIYSTFINLGSDFASTTLANTGAVVGDFSPVLTVVIPVLIGALIIFILVRAFTH